MGVTHFKKHLLKLQHMFITKVLLSEVFWFSVLFLCLDRH